MSDSKQFFAYSNVREFQVSYLKISNAIKISKQNLMSQIGKSFNFQPDGSVPNQIKFSFLFKTYIVEYNAIHEKGRFQIALLLLLQEDGTETGLTLRLFLNPDGSYSGESEQKITDTQYPVEQILTAIMNYYNDSLEAGLY